jgi:hypothetical protein
MRLAAAILMCVTSVTLAQDRVELRRFPLDSMDELLTKEGVRIDRISTDRGGSVLVRARGFTVVPLVDTGPLDVEDVVVSVRGKMRVVSVKGDAYLELTCRLPGQGEISAQGLQYALSGNRHWTDVEVSYRLRKGEKPENIRVSLVATASGRIWLDDLKLEMAPLPQE